MDEWGVTVTDFTFNCYRIGVQIPRRWPSECPGLPNLIRAAEDQIIEPDESR